MTSNEVSVLLGILRTAYPRFYMDMTKAEIKNTVDLWADYLSDVDLETAKTVIQSLIAKCKFPPTIAELREQVSNIKYASIDDVGMAWGEVTSAIKKFGLYSQEEALASMSEITRQIVKRLGFRELCLSDNTMADRAHFFRIYNIMVSRLEEERLLPDAMRSKIQTLADSMAISQLPQVLSADSEYNYFQSGDEREGDDYY